MEKNTLTEQFMLLPVDSLVQFTPDIKKIPVTESKIEGKGILQAQNLTAGKLVPKGESYPLIVFDNGNILFKRNDGFYFFDRSTTLIGESSKQFYKHGEEFGRLGQIPGCYVFKWQEMSLNILDIGYQVYKHQSGYCHLIDNIPIKYMIAKTDKGEILYLEVCSSSLSALSLQTIKYPAIL